MKVYNTCMCLINLSTEPTHATRGQQQSATHHRMCAQQDFDALAIPDLGACNDDGCWLWQPPVVSGAKPARRKAVVCKRALSDTPDSSTWPEAARPAGEAAGERGGECAGHRAGPACVRGLVGRRKAFGAAPALAARRKVHVADVYFAEELHASLHHGTSYRHAQPLTKSQKHARRDVCARPAADAPSSAGGRPADGTAVEGAGDWLLYTDAAHLLLDAVGIKCSREGSDDFALRFACQQ